MPIRAFYLNVDPRFPTANKSDNTDKNRHPLRRRICLEPICYRRNLQHAEGTHKKYYHSGDHDIQYKGQTVTITRRPDGFYDCPCCAPPHRHLDWQKLRRLCLLEEHPGPLDGSQYPDEPFEVYSPQILAKIQAHFGADPYTLEEPSGVRLGSAAIGDHDGDVEMKTDAVGNNDGDVTMLYDGPSAPESVDSLPAPSLGHSPPVPSTSDSNLDSGNPNEKDDDSDADSSNGNSVSDNEDAEGDGENESVILLRRWNILVDPTTRRTVCTACRRLVKADHIHSHQKKNHFKSQKIPPHL
ncbi:hypothetical protein PM082_011253 [Marasmius tenuissimus]|nr:hypothetical protein PM082_011253 [Marasmius tenuissimus]